MRVDAAVVALVTITASLLMVASYSRLSSVYAGALDCYERAALAAKQVASSGDIMAAAKDLAGRGFAVTLFYANGTSVSFGRSRGLCSALAVAEAGKQPVLVRVDG